MPVNEKLKALVDKMPNPDNRGMFTTIDKEQVDRAIEEIREGGQESVLGLIGLLVPPGQGDDVKAHYALHCLAVHVCTLEDDEPRQVFAETLAAQLGGDRPKPVQAYLCQELQTAGGKEAIKPLGKLLTDPELCEPAAQALTAIGGEAAEELAAALPKAAGKCRLTIVQSLGVLRCEKAIEALQQAAGDGDGEIRIAAVWGLANIGEAQGMAVVLKAADAKPGWERIQATKACLVLAERLLADRKKDEAKAIYTRLRDSRTDPAEKYVRDVAEKALAAIK